MTKHIVSFAAVILSCSFSFAQRFKAGLFAGVSTSQVHGDTYSGFNKAGLYAGASLAKKFSEESKWESSFEISYIQKGSRKLANPSKGDYKSYYLNLDYAEVPVLLRYHFSIADTTRSFSSNFFIEGGLSFGALVNQKESDENGVILGGIPFEKYDISTVFGLSYSLRKNVFFNIRTINSFIPVRKFNIPIYYPRWFLNLFNRGYYNNVLAFSLRCQF